MNEWPSIFPNVSFQKEHVLERKPAVLFPTFPTSKYVLHTKKHTLLKDEGEEMKSWNFDSECLGVSKKKVGGTESADR